MDRHCNGHATHHVCHAWSDEASDPGAQSGACDWSLLHPDNKYMTHVVDAPLRSFSSRRAAHAREDIHTFSVAKGRSPRGGIPALRPRTIPLKRASVSTSEAIWPSSPELVLTSQSCAPVQCSFTTFTSVCAREGINWPVVTDFGLSNLGQSNLGQSILGHSNFGPIQLLVLLLWLLCGCLFLVVVVVCLLLFVCGCWFGAPPPHRPPPYRPAASCATVLPPCRPGAGPPCHPAALRRTAPHRPPPDRTAPPSAGPHRTAHCPQCRFFSLSRHNFILSSFSWVSSRGGVLKCWDCHVARGPTLRASSLPRPGFSVWGSGSRV